MNPESAPSPVDQLLLEKFEALLAECNLIDNTGVSGWTCWTVELL
jgi:hypothetical protein